MRFMFSTADLKRAFWLHSSSPLLCCDLHLTARPDGALHWPSLLNERLPAQTSWATQQIQPQKPLSPAPAPAGSHTLLCTMQLQCSKHSHRGVATTFEILW